MAWAGWSQSSSTLPASSQVESRSLRGEVVPFELPGFGVFDGSRLVALVTYHLSDDGCEIVTLASDRPSKGLGSRLLEDVAAVAKSKGLRRVWLITTNDNTDALRFYQKRGFSLAALHRGAVDRSRRIKPEISLRGNDGIPIRDEIELELLLES